MSDNGWGFTTLERDIFTKQVFEDRKLLQLYVYLRSQAKYKPTNKLINNKWRELQPGELTLGNKQLAAVLGVSPATAFRMLKKLQKLREITTENLITCTLIRLTYWPQKSEKSETASELTAASDTADILSDGEIEMKSKRNANETQMKSPITGYKENRKTKESTPVKKQYHEFVTLTEAEHAKLVDKYSEPFVNRCIEVLNNYKGSSGKRYKSDYHTILKWVAERVQQERPVNSRPKEDKQIAELRRRGG